MVQTGLYLLSAVMITTPLILIHRFSQAESAVKTRKTLIYSVWMLVWGIYVTLISNSGILDTTDLPPRLPLLIILPAIISAFLFLSGKGAHTIIHTTSKAFPVYIQAFRIFVELLIYGAFLEGILSKQVTFEGTNFDILVGISALVMGFLIHKGKVSDKGILIWNIAALLILTGSFISFMYSFFFAGEIFNPEGTQFIRVPYLLVAAILLPFAIFYHIISIRQVRRKS